MRPRLALSLVAALLAAACSPAAPAVAVSSASAPPAGASTASAPAGGASTASAPPATLSSASAPAGGASTAASAPSAPVAAAQACVGTPASAALDAARSKVTGAYQRDHDRAEAARSQPGATAGMVDTVEANLASARDAAIATLTTQAGTGCLDASAAAALDAATAAQVAKLDGLMPSGPSGPSQGGAGAPPAPAGGQSGGTFGSGGGNTSALPACSAGDVVLDSVPADPAQILNIVPLGNMSGPHVLPDQADHVYFYPQSHASMTTVYAPGNVTIVSVVSQTHFDPNSPASKFGDYEIDFSPCKSLLFWFAHVTALSDRLKTALAAVASPQCSTASVGNTGTTNCSYPDLGLKLTSGEPIASFGGPGAEALAFDFGAVDIRTTGLGYIDAAAPAGTMPDSYLHAACPLDYFADAAAGRLTALLASSHAGANGIPACGATMQDKAGTIQGNWYRSGATKAGAVGPVDFLDALAIVHQNTDPALGVISAGGSLVGGDSGIQIVFQPTSSGSVDREPSQVTADGHIYCYQDMQRADAHFDLQLVDASTLKIDHPSGGCAASPALTGPVTYIR